MTTVLVIGASGATGSLLVSELLERGMQVKVVLRPTGVLPEETLNHENLAVIRGSILGFNDGELLDLLSDCDVVASCLGHNLSFKGVFGPPWRLVRDSVKRVCQLVESNLEARPLKVLLMNTTGNINANENEKVSFAQKCVLCLLRILVPPHVDNEQAADYLRLQIGQKHKCIEWTAVRPDTLINEESSSEYDIHPSPIRSAIFDAGKTSRNNVAHFMADLIEKGDLWKVWKGKMPVVYNCAQTTEN